MLTMHGRDSLTNFLEVINIICNFPHQNEVLNNHMTTLNNLNNHMTLTLTDKGIQTRKTDFGKHSNRTQKRL